MDIAIKYGDLVHLQYNQLNDFQGALKTLPEANYQKLKKEIMTTGFAFAPHVWKNPADQQYYICDGHQRLATVKRMVEQEGMQAPAIPCIPVQASSYKEAKRRVLQAASQYGKVTEDGLRDFVVDFGFEIEDFSSSFDFPDVKLPSFVNEYFRKESDPKDDEVPAPPTIPKVKSGDLYILGGHRLLCGDSSKIIDVERLMGGEKSDMVFTSPPYNVGIKYSGYDDKKPDDEYMQLMRAILTNSFISMKDGRLIAWNVGVSPKSKPFRHAVLIEECGFQFFRHIVWKKTGAQIPLWQNSIKKPLARNYLPNYNHEVIYMASKGELVHGETTQMPDKISMDVWDVCQFQAGGNNHPAAFPVALVELAMEVMSAKGENVFEPFGGAGSTMIAAEKIGRRCYVMEIDPQYCDVILDRWAAFTGQDPTREDGKSWSQIKAE